MIQITNQLELVTLIEGDKLTNDQVSKVVESCMGLFLSNDEVNLNRKELGKLLIEHHDKYLQDNTQIRPLFLRIECNLI